MDNSELREKLTKKKQWCENFKHQRKKIKTISKRPASSWPKGLRKNVVFFNIAKFNSKIQSMNMNNLSKYNSFSKNLKKKVRKHKKYKGI